MKHLILLISFFIMVACKPSSNGNPNPVTDNDTIADQSQAQNPNIDITTAKKMLVQNKEIILIDVRTSDEVNRGKIENSLHIDISQPDFKTKIDALDKNKEYIVYCAVGGRSSTALGIMQQLGFKKAYNMMGGYNGWIKN